MRLEPKEHYRYHVLAPLLVVTRARTAYDELCAQMLANFSNTSNPYVAERVVRDNLLWLRPGIDLLMIDQLAEVAVTRGASESGLSFFQLCKALSDYRQGRFPAAIEWAEKTLGGSHPYARAQAFAVLGMARWQLQQKDQARAVISRGNALAPNISFAPGGKD